MQILLAALGALVNTTYWPDVAGAATSSRWIAIGFAAPCLLFYPRRIRITIAHLAGGCLLAWACLTYVWSINQNDTIGGLFYFALLAIVFCLGSLCENLRIFYIACAVGLISSALIAIAQWFGWQGIWQIASPSGLFVNRNFYAEICAALAVALIAERLWWWLLPLLPGLLLTQARGALLALCVGVGLLALVRRERLLIGAVIGLLVLALFAIAQRGDASFWLRLDFWREAVKHVTWFGSGLATWPDISAQLPSYYQIEHVHNDMLEYAVEIGVFGCALLLLFAGTLVLAARKSAQLPTEAIVLIAIGVEALFEFPWHEPATAFLGCAAAGCLARGLPCPFVEIGRGRMELGAWYQARVHQFRQCISSLGAGTRALSLSSLFQGSGRR